MIQPRVCVSHILAVGAPEDNRRTVALVLEDVRIGLHFLASTVTVAALELDLRQQVSGYSVNFVKLGV